VCAVVTKKRLKKDKKMRVKKINVERESVRSKNVVLSNSPRSERERESERGVWIMEKIPTLLPHSRRVERERVREKE
jgi:hypothetical protein